MVILSIIKIATPLRIQPDTCSEMVNTDCEPISALGIGQVTVRDDNHHKTQRLRICVHLLNLAT